MCSRNKMVLTLQEENCCAYLQCSKKPISEYLIICWRKKEIIMIKRISFFSEKWTHSAMTLRKILFQMNFIFIWGFWQNRNDDDSLLNLQMLMTDEKLGNKRNSELHLIQNYFQHYLVINKSIMFIMKHGKTFPNPYYFQVAIRQKLLWNILSHSFIIVLILLWDFTWFYECSPLVTVLSDVSLFVPVYYNNSFRKHENWSSL